MHLYTHSHVRTHTERKVLGQKNIKDFKFLLRKSDLILVFYRGCCPAWSHLLYLSLNHWQLAEPLLLLVLLDTWSLVYMQLLNFLCGPDWSWISICLHQPSEAGLKTCATCLILFVCLGFLLLPLLVALVGLVLVLGLKPKGSKFYPNTFDCFPWPSLVCYVSCLVFNLCLEK